MKHIVTPVYLMLCGCNAAMYTSTDVLAKISLMWCVRLDQDEQKTQILPH